MPNPKFVQNSYPASSEKVQINSIKNRCIFLLTAQEYYKELLSGFMGAHKQIKICTMNLVFGSLMDKLFTELIAALKRGVSVELVIDKYSLFMFKEGAYANSTQVSITKDRLNELKSNGAKINTIGSIGLNPFSHRMHTKLTIIDNTLFAFGGINFDEDAFLSNDIMFKITDPRYMVIALDILEKIKTETLDNTEIKISTEYSILTDGGIPKESIIYEKACVLTKASGEIYLSSRMCPSGVLGKLIKEHNGVCYFNRPSLAPFPTNLSIIIDQLRTGLDNKYKSNKFLHSKFILFKQRDGTKSFLCGSNNFNWRGVKYGTKEIAIFSKDSSSWNELYNYMMKL